MADKNPLKRHSVRRRIVGTFGAIIALGLVVQIFSHWVEIRRGERIGNLLRDCTQIFDEYMRLMHNFNQGSHALSLDPAGERTWTAADEATNDQTVRDSLARLEEMTDSPDVVAALEEAQADFEHLVKITSDVRAGTASLPELWTANEVFTEALIGMAAEGGNALREEIEAARENAKRMVLARTVLFVVAFLFAIYLIFRLGRSITKPIEALSMGVDEFAHGNLHVSIGVKGNDEFSDLAAHFEDMSHQLQQQLSEGKTAADLGMMVCSTLEVDEIATRLLGVVRQLTTARLGVLIMRDPVQGAWLRYISEGEQKIKKDAVKDLMSAASEVSQESLTLISVPLIAQEEVIGTLELRGLEDESGIARKTNLVSSLLVSVSMALRNAHFVEELHREKEKVAEKAAELVMANRDLAAVQKFKSRFLASMSHRLRTPLNSVVGCTDLMLGGVFGDTTEKQREAMETVKRCSHDLLGIIDHILNYSKLESSDVEMLWGEFTVAEVIEDALNRLGQIQTLDRVAPDITVTPPDLKLNSDKIKLRFMLQYLLESAMGPKREGELIIRAKATENGVQFHIVNSALVFNQRRMETLYEPFQDPEETESPGAGLGLTITKRLAELVNAELNVTSEEKSGTQFTLTIPHHRP